MHEKKVGTPTMGGILIWGVTLFLAALFSLLADLFPQQIIQKLNFLDRAQTLLPLGAFLGAACIGLVDDLLTVRGFGSHEAGIRFRYKIFAYLIVAGIGAWWFFSKLDWDIIHIPFHGDVPLGWVFIPLFILIVIGTSFSVNETDGLDGLAAGVLLTNFAVFLTIALFQEKYFLASLCGVIIGSLLAFLWFNIPPARFFMGDTGSMALGTVLAVIAFMTKSVFLLPIVGIIFVIETGSLFIQLASRKFRKGKGVFASAPLHHHIEVKGWPESKIVMRFWVISAVFGSIALSIALLDPTI